MLIVVLVCGTSTATPARNRHSVARHFYSHLLCGQVQKKTGQGLWTRSTSCATPLSPDISSIPTATTYTLQTSGSPPSDDSSTSSTLSIQTAQSYSLPNEKIQREISLNV